jgi:hypothetical protein
MARHAKSAYWHPASHAKVEHIYDGCTRSDLSATGTHTETLGCQSLVGHPPLFSLPIFAYTDYDKPTLSPQRLIRRRNTRLVLRVAMALAQMALASISAAKPASNPCTIITSIRGEEKMLNEGMGS